jgi:hypothetical protein
MTCPASRYFRARRTWSRTRSIGAVRERVLRLRAVLLGHARINSDWSEVNSVFDFVHHNFVYAMHAHNPILYRAPKYRRISDGFCVFQFSKLRKLPVRYPVNCFERHAAGT